MVVPVRFGDFEEQIWRSEGLENFADQRHASHVQAHISTQLSKPEKY